MSLGKGPVGSVALSVGFAVGIYGVSFGALSVTAGFDIWQTIALSVLMFSGGSQFAFVAVFASGGLAALPAAITSAWLVGIRNGFYALSLAPTIGPRGFMKILASQLTIDESTAVSTSRTGLKEQRAGFWLTGISVFVFWNSATVIGALLGGVVSDPKVFGLDAAAAAALFALVWPRIQNSIGALIAACSIVLSCLFALVLPSGFPVLAGAVIAVLIGFWFEGRRK
jgi:predicted branched-subunit amino acid permease